MARQENDSQLAIPSDGPEVTCELPTPSAALPANVNVLDGTSAVPPAGSSSVIQKIRTKIGGFVAEIFTW